MILHFIQTSPTHDGALTTCLRFIDKDDTLVLAGDGVTSLLLTDWQQRLANYRVLLLKDDVSARGLTQALAGYSHIDQHQFVEQTMQHLKVISW